MKTEIAVLKEIERLSSEARAAEQRGKDATFGDGPGGMSSQARAEYTLSANLWARVAALNWVLAK